MANTPQEKLARAQALFLYQIIGLFDGDVTLRSNADRNMPLLQDWLDELCKIRDNLGMPGIMNDRDPPRSWEVCLLGSLSLHSLTAEVVDIDRREVRLRKLVETETPPLRCRIVRA